MTNSRTRPTGRDPPRLRLEELESRNVPSIVIQFDYSFDTSGFFNDPGRRAILQKAANDLAGHLDADLTAAGEAALTRYRRDHVGFVFQFYNLIPSLTARENVALVTEIARDPMTPEDALRLVGLGDRMDHFPSQLSGGEQQRVAIARAVAKRPQVLLCDEPTGALDLRTGVVVLEAINRVNRELGTTTAVITHNVSIADMADRVVSIADGRVTGVRTNPTKKAPRDLAW